MKLVTCTAILALWCASQPAAAQSGTAPFCLQTPGGTSCTFSTMGACENSRNSMSSAQCITRSDAHGTTGLGQPQTNKQDLPRVPPAGARPSYGK